ncbi:MAG: LPS assembly lipoprotein LptE [Gammaproteobacteria bacterium]|nr:MAG: LPS assembly lipoprotein LptE [Gammaproteobacteria bacterium]
MFSPDVGMPLRGAWALILLLSMTLSACGFHLRGQQAVTLPPAFKHLRLVSDSANADLRNIIEDVLVTQGGAVIADANQVPVTTGHTLPVLELKSEGITRQVLAVSVVGAKVSEYRLRYRLDYVWQQETQSIQLLREYTFDPLNVLAKEREQELLVYEMQHEAARQILRRLARSKPQAKKVTP